MRIIVPSESRVKTRYARLSERLGADGARELRELLIEVAEQQLGATQDLIKKHESDEPHRR